MTVIMAAQSYADSPGWYNGQMLIFRFGITQVGNEPIYSRPVNIGGDFSITTALHDMATAMIGAGLLNSFFTGNVGEIIIYDRALATAERELTESYLRIKYGVH